MDTFRAVARRLVVAFCLVFALGVALISAPASAQSSGPVADAMAMCNNWVQVTGRGTPPCQYFTPSQVPGGTANPPGSLYGYACWQPIWNCYAVQGPSPPSNPCSSLNSWSGDFSYGAGQSIGSAGGQMVTDPNSGGQVWCPAQIHCEASGVMDAYGHMHAQCTVTYSGNPASSAPAGAAPNGATYSDANGTPLVPQPTDTPGPSPQICGGGSCYDPNNNTYCATGDSGQVCVSGSTASTSSGGCSSSGASTLCAGSPTPPSPVGSSGSQITSPPSQITSSDGYSQQSGSGGGVSTVTVNTYTGAGGQTQSGALSSSTKAANSSSPGSNSGPASSSSAPASSSSSPSKDSDGGGGDCNTPPVCQGDAVMCGIQRQEWISMCVQQGYMVGNGQQPPTFSADQSKYSQNDVWQQPSAGGNTVGDAANNGSYDSSGFGYGTACPLQDLSVPFINGQTITMPFSEGCVVGPWIRALVIGLALFSAAVITAGGRG